jgi:hypothetical protein
MLDLQVRIQTTDADVERLVPVFIQLAATEPDDLRVWLEVSGGLASLPDPARARLQELQAALGSRLRFIRADDWSRPEPDAGPDIGIGPAT